MKREIITRLLVDEIQNKQSTDCYQFSTANIFWVESQEYFGLKNEQGYQYASPGDIGDLIDLLTDEDLEDWFYEEFDGQSPMDILDAVLAIVSSDLETAE
jgi:hypothetical protein